MQFPHPDHTGSIYGPATLVGATQPAPKDARLKQLISLAEERARGHHAEDMGALIGSRISLVFDARRPSIPVTSWQDIEDVGSGATVLVSLKYVHGAILIPLKTGQVLAQEKGGGPPKFQTDRPPDSPKGNHE